MTVLETMGSLTTLMSPVRISFFPHQLQMALLQVSNLRNGIVSLSILREHSHYKGPSLLIWKEGRQNMGKSRVDLNLFVPVSKW